MRLGERHESVISNEFNIEELQNTFPYLNWYEYINWNLNHSVTIDESVVIMVPDMNYLHQLNELIENTPTRTVANYFAWRAVFFSSDLLNNSLLLRSQQYNTATAGKLKPDSRLAECAQKTLQ